MACLVQVASVLYTYQKHFEMSKEISFQKNSKLIIV